MNLSSILLLICGAEAFKLDHNKLNLNNGPEYQTLIQQLAKQKVENNVFIPDVNMGD